MPWHAHTPWDLKLAELGLGTLSYSFWLSMAAGSATHCNFKNPNPGNLGNPNASSFQHSRHPQHACIDRKSKERRTGHEGIPVVVPCKFKHHTISNVKDAHWFIPVSVPSVIYVSYKIYYFRGVSTPVLCVPESTIAIWHIAIFEISTS